MTLLTEMGVEAHSFGIIPDDQLKYQELLSKLCSDSYDGVISTGAVSMGKFDFVSDALKALGAKIHFHKASIRPGKPILFAELKAAERNLAFFGMPGNPVSTAVGCRFFFAPYLRAISGLGSEVPAKAKLVLGIKKPEGMRCFYKARMYIEPDGIQAVALKSQASYVVSSFVESNCWAIFPEDGSHFAEGALVDIVPLSVRRGFNDYDSN
jgi:molybdopterin molybdotransferase